MSSRYLWMLRPQMFYSPDDGGGAGGTGQTTSTGTASQAAHTDSAAASSGVGRFTQADIDRVVSERLARNSEAFEKRLSKVQEESVTAFREERGLTDDVLSRLSTVDSEKLTLKTEIKQLKQLLTDLEGKHAPAVGRLRTLIVDDAVTRVAAPLAANGDTEPILALLKPSLKIDEKDWKAYHTDPNGEPSGKSIEDAVKELLERKPQLAAATGRHGSGSPPRTGTALRVNSEEDTPERRMAILRSGGFGT